MVVGKLYKVEWQDTFSSTSGWYDFDDIKEYMEGRDGNITTIGYYAGRMKGFEILAAQKTPNPDKFKEWANIMFIPKGCIKKVKKMV